MVLKWRSQPLAVPPISHYLPPQRPEIVPGWRPCPPGFCSRRILQTAKFRGLPTSPRDLGEIQHIPKENMDGDRAGFKAWPRPRS
jgi:hypothetical protein